MQVFLRGVSFLLPYSIYLEPLLRGINGHCGVEILDIFGYADDLMIICDSMDQLKKCIGFPRGMGLS